MLDVQLEHLGSQGRDGLAENIEPVAGILPLRKKWRLGIFVVRWTLVRRLILFYLAPDLVKWSSGRCIEGAKELRPNSRESQIVHRRLLTPVQARARNVAD